MRAKLLILTQNNALKFILFIVKLDGEYENILQIFCKYLHFRNYEVAVQSINFTVMNAFLAPAISMAKNYSLLCKARILVALLLKTLIQFYLNYIEICQMTNTSIITLTVYSLPSRGVDLIEHKC